MLLTQFDQKNHDRVTRRNGIQIGEERAYNKVNTLNSELIKANRIDDLQRSAEDPAYQQELFREFGIK